MDFESVSVRFAQDDSNFQDDENGGLFIEEDNQKEHMFDKVVTPSDVGKLNRLVIPKQHAEKYFPLDSSSKDKGLLLNFEDNRNRKSWRFRYSYWTSSQSYVMTKGWSRFVKEKRLDAGDIVSFQRGVISKDRFYIDWRRRPHTTAATYQSQIMRPLPVALATPLTLPLPLFVHRDHVSYMPHHTQNNNVSLSLLHNNPYRNCFAGGSYPCQEGSVYYLRSEAPAMTTVELGEEAATEKPMIMESAPVAQAKRLRLFGVNMECPVSESTATATASETSSSGRLELYKGTDQKGKSSSRSSSSSMSLDIGT